MDAEKYVKMEPRCVFTNGEPLPNVHILLVYEDIVRVIVIVNCNEFYGFSYKRDAKEFIRERFGVAEFQIQPCNRRPARNPSP
ncbi:MAG: hypothetical protein RXR06_11355 [Thermoproteus sp.]